MGPIPARPDPFATFPLASILTKRPPIVGPRAPVGWRGVGKSLVPKSYRLPQSFATSNTLARVWLAFSTCGLSVVAR